MRPRPDKDRGLFITHLPTADEDMNSKDAAAQKLEETHPWHVR